MTRAPEALWQALPADWALQLAAACQKADRERDGATAVFFRADDIAVPGRQMAHLLAVFHRHALPLALAVVPAWLTVPRWQALCAMSGNQPERWCWHQHGWRHQNHEPEGKKQEFGPARSREALARDLERGRQRLATIMGARFTPLFTPPWNRCSEITLELLEEMGYKAVSRSRGSRPSAAPGMPDLPVAIDLHTDRSPDAGAGWQRLRDALAVGLSRPTCGIMIHHQRMNAAAFTFLDRLLEILTQHPRLKVVDMRDLVP
jgi:peptidoglycan/xylan/chitin deacetylase (PgdA/CDA1 family)